MSREHDVILTKYNQLIDKLDATDPVQHPQEFGAVLDMLDRIHFFMGRLSVEKANEVRAIGEAISLTVTDVKLPSCNVGEKIGAPVVEETAAPAPVSSEPTEELEEPAKTYSKEEVRAALAKSRKQGVNVTELLGELGYDNFSAVPAGKYGEIMARLGES